MEYNHCEDQRENIPSTASDFYKVNPLPPSDAVRKQKKIFHKIFSVQYGHILKDINPLEIWNSVI